VKKKTGNYKVTKADRIAVLDTIPSLSDLIENTPVLAKSGGDTYLVVRINNEIFYNKFTRSL